VAYKGNIVHPGTSTSFLSGFSTVTNFRGFG
jgi:hypothetical protein